MRLRSASGSWPGRIPAPIVPSTSCSTTTSWRSRTARALVVLALGLATAARPAAAVAQADPAGPRAAVERANSAAVWGEALRSGDPAPLATAWDGDALDYFSGEVLTYRARGLRLLSTPLDFEVVTVELAGGGRALAYTHEQWLDRLCTAEGELRAERQAEVRDRYELSWHDNAWWVSGVDVALIGGSFDWTPAEDPEDGPSPCAAIAE